MPQILLLQNKYIHKIRKKISKILGVFLDTFIASHITAGGRGQPLTELGIWEEGYVPDSCRVKARASADAAVVDQLMKAVADQLMAAVLRI